MPRTTGSRNRNISLSFMVNDSEHTLIKEKMALAGISNMRAYLAKMAVDGYVIRLDLSGVGELVSLLRNATNNINQIARRVNGTNSIYRDDITEIQAHCEQLWQKADGILRKLAEI